MMRPKATALLVDLDGTLRRWDPDVIHGIEAAHDLKPGSLYAAAMDWSRLMPAIIGEITHDEWADVIAADLTEQTGDPDRARAAVKEWENYRGTVEPGLLQLVRDARAAGIRVGLATNATDLLPTDLRTLGLADEFDVVINSSELRIPKPAPEYFGAACLALHTAPSHVLFVDDSDRFVRGARAAGLAAHRWTGPSDLPYLRAALDL
ncbi:HAD-IA family hydrolase [Asanoa sp. WMMD1127]|uniref:HAD family hydrolase n=1 Tax=Asanoa sp. WMMD1127 TaxID=3016107 RepID=UPI002416DB50|nr:HAD-IA family hydrolase [Asanoa sp. WMMD1127]MDG4823554.1 HAD-IA family hydrolase [Asanoa sp. WMMD1127]